MPNCNICKYAGRPIYKSPCSECKEFSKYEYENKKTNADIIRSMSEEELSYFLAYTWATSARAWQKDTGETLRWLKQRAEVE